MKGEGNTDFARTRQHARVRVQCRFLFHEYACVTKIGAIAHTHTQQLLQLGEQIGDVAKDMWKLDAHTHIAKLPTRVWEGGSEDAK